MRFLKKTKIKIQTFITIIFIILFGVYLNKPVKAFIPYVYEPSPEELKKTGTNIGQTAIQMLQLGQPTEAIKLVELGLTLNPKDYRLWSILGEAQRRNRQLNKASYSMQKAKLLNPKKAELWFAEGAIALESKHPDKALPLLKEGLILDPKNELGYFQLGNCRLMLKNFRLSLKAFEKAVEIRPSFWEALNNQGIVLFETGKTKKAINVWRKVLKLENNSEPMLALGAALNSLEPGNLESIKLAKTALRKDPNYVSSVYQREQLWGSKLVAEASELLSQKELSEDVERALANSYVKN